MKRLNLTRETIGYWTVGESFKKENGRIYYHCTCKCGKKRDIYGSSLKNNGSLSCGCLRTEIANDSVEDLTNRDFGKLHVKEKIIINKHTYWLCECLCGGSKIATSNNLQSGAIQSCGCKRQESGETIKKAIQQYCVDGTYIPAITRTTLNKNNTSGYNGVSYRKERNKYRAYIKFQRKNIFLGYFDKIEDAIEVRKIAEIEYFGKVINDYQEMYS